VFVLLPLWEKAALRVSKKMGRVHYACPHYILRNWKKNNKSEKIGKKTINQKNDIESAASS
jgi:DNA replication protein DnaD